MSLSQKMNDVRKTDRPVRKIESVFILIGLGVGLIIMIQVIVLAVDFDLDQTYCDCLANPDHINWNGDSFSCGDFLFDYPRRYNNGTIINCVYQRNQ